MRTRISTQPLHYRAGDEKTALDSIVELFRMTRELARRHSYECRHFATLTVWVLNVVIRPFTATWHKEALGGAFEAEDGRHRFRTELQRLQVHLRTFQTLLGRLAEGENFRPGSESGLECVLRKVPDLGGPIPFDRLLALPREVGRKLVDAESAEMTTRRGTPAGTSLCDLVGLSISGGGIRSATFALGVLQTLAQSDVLKQVDVLSTVSGGGYLGAFLSSYLNDAERPENSARDVGLSCSQLPFRRETACETQPLRYLRNHSRYLVSGGFWGHVKLAAQAFYGVLMNLLIFCPLVVGTVLATRYGYESEMGTLSLAVQTHRPPPWALALPVVVLCLVWGVLVFFLPLLQKVARISTFWLPVRRSYEWLCVGGFIVSLAAVLLNWVPNLHYLFLSWNERLSLYSPGAGFNWQTVPFLIANLAAFASARSATIKSIGRRVPKLGKLLLAVLWLSGPVLLVVLYFLLCEMLLVRPEPCVPEFVSRDGFLWLLFVVPLIYAAGFLNVNFISPHRYYRNRLCETYLLRPSPTADGVEAVDPQPLSSLGRTAKSPYHLLNGALNLPACGNPELRGRNADFFLFSKHFCGSPILGYLPTADWERHDGHFDLGTAMAISGAAASPHMGTQSIRGASFWLTLLNIRLGCWLRRPDYRLLGILPAPARLVKLLGAPGPSYLVREMFGRLHERAAYVNVADGGHLENLGTYELLRRRCKFIIAIDGECDPKLECGALIRLQRFAWIDLGIRIDIDSADVALEDSGLSPSHFTLGTIHYPGSEGERGERGFLLYVKLSVTGNEPPYVQEYRRRHSDFPHQSTADQLFDEDQFEAYRALGAHVGEDLFREEVLGSLRLRSFSVQNWFQALAANLLVA